MRRGARSGAWWFALILGASAPLPAAPHPHNTYDVILHPRPLRSAPPKSAGAEMAPATLRWNALLLDAIRINRTFPPAATRTLAMAHGAMFEAANSITPRYRPYAGALPVEPGASVPAAIAAAAHGVARVGFPAQSGEWDAFLAEDLAAVPDAAARARGRALGAAAAAAMLAARTGDGATATSTYQPGTAPGRWRPTRPDFLPALTPQWGDVHPFAISGVEAFLAPPPPALSSTAYAQDYHEVKLLGEVFFHTRTEEQTRIAYFWSDPAGSSSPPGHWNLVAAQCIAERGLDELTATRTLALFNFALADAAIVCWRDKYTADFWRPITAINLGDTDGNPATEVDTLWTPLLTTPRFPDHTSGHSTFSGAAAEVLGAIFGRTTPLSISSDALPENYGIANFTRTFPSFDAAASEASFSRILGGIHFRSACEEGLRSGRKIGEEVRSKLLLPVGEDGWVGY